MPRRAVRGVALLLALGLVGAFLVSLLGPIAIWAGFENTLAQTLDDFSVFGQLCLVVLVAPLWEELLYRLVLKSCLQLWLLTLAGIALAMVHSWWLLIPTAVVALVWVIQCFSGNSRADGFVSWWEQHPRWPVYISITMFAGAHLGNFTVDWTLLALAVAPIAVAPQIWLGLTFTIARVRYGWWASVILHAMHNLLVWTIGTAV